MDKLIGLDLMGECILNRVKYCGENVRIFPLCKMIHPENAELDNNCQLFDYVFIDAGQCLKIGKYSTVTWNCLIEGGATTKIGDRVFIGPGSKLLTSTYEIDGFYSIEHIPEQCRKTRYGDIYIEDDAYIGANCTVMPGTIICKGAVLGANSMAKGILEPWTVYVGSPCKPLRKRIRPNKEKEEQLLQINWENHL